MATLWVQGKQIIEDPSFRVALAIYAVTRVFLSVWAAIALALNPLPGTVDETVRPYLGEPQLEEGAAGILLGPWQRFDTQRYMHIARLGYANEENSVFPPLFPLAIRLVGLALGGGTTANLIAGVAIANLCWIGLMVLLHKAIWNEKDRDTATRSLVYLSVFPTGFFLMAPYSESLFILLALSSLWSARRGNFWRAGLLGALASLTRLTGWILVVPLAYEYWSQSRKVAAGDAGMSPLMEPGRRRFRAQLAAVGMPAVALLGFLAWRWAAGHAALGAIYERYWYQTVALPGLDIVSAVGSLFFGGIARNNEFLRRLPLSYGLYSAMLLLFMLLPSSPVKPLYSFSRYALAFFPTYMLLGMAGARPMINRLILYPSVLMYLYFSGQFFVWGWVA
jgi:hypothetical protein